MRVELCIKYEKQFPDCTCRVSFSHEHLYTTDVHLNFCYNFLGGFVVFTCLLHNDLHYNNNFILRLQHICHSTI